VIVRHVLVPGHFECCFRPLTNWLAAHLPHIRFQLYDGYVPCGRGGAPPPPPPPQPPPPGGPPPTPPARRAPPASIA
jgi:hypothetical protein